MDGSISPWLRTGVPRRTAPRLLADRRSESGYDGAARRARPAPRALPEQGQGAEVLPVRRLAAARVPGARRRTQQPRVDLAATALPRPVRRGHRRPERRREHAVLPLPPRRPAPHRERPSSGAARGGAARPGRPCVLELDAPVGGRARAVRRRHRGVRAGGGAGGRRVGAVLALPRFGHVRPTGSGPVRALPARAGAAAALPEPHRRPLVDAQPGLPVPGRLGGRRDRDPVRELTAVRVSQRADADARPSRPRRGGGGPVPASPGLANGEQAAGRTAAPARPRRPGRGSRPRTVRCCASRSSRT